MTYAPVAVFAYSRADKLKKCLEALERNPLVDRTDLFLFADGAKGATDYEKVEQVKDFIHQYQKESKFSSVTVIEQPQNLGLANSIIGGVTKVINEHKKIIVVEDDLIVSEDFLSYMNQGLDYYEDMKEYGSISSYTYPLPELKNYPKDIYVTHKGECQGWGTWYDRWHEVDWTVSDFGVYMRDKKKRKAFDAIEKGLDSMLIAQQAGQVDSWAVRWCYHLFNHQLLTVYPRVSRVRNIGFDGSGVNSGDSEMVARRHNGDVISRKDYNGKSSVAFERMPANMELEHKAAVYWRLSLGERAAYKLKLLLKKFIGQGKDNENKTLLRF